MANSRIDLESTAAIRLHLHEKKKYTFIELRPDRLVGSMLVRRNSLRSSTRSQLPGPSNGNCYARGARELKTVAMCFALSRTRVRTRTNERTGVHEGGTRAVRPFERLTRPSKTASTISVDHPTYSRSNSTSRSFFGTFHISLDTLVNVVLGHRDWEFSRILIFRRPIFLSRSLRSGSGTYFTLSRNVSYELTLAAEGG